MMKLSVAIVILKMAHLLIEIPAVQWPTLRDMYASKERFYSCSYNMLQLLITRLKSDPYVNARIYSLDGDWQKDGLFIAMLYKENVCMNILSEDVTRLTLALSCLPKHQSLHFYAVPIKTNPAIRNLFDLINLRMEDYEISMTHWHFIPRDIVRQWDITPPDGFSLRALEVQHSDFVNNAWPHKSPNSVNFVKTLIKNLPSVGVFDKHDSLIAWCLMLPVGALGLLQVIPEYQQKGFAALAVKALSKKFLEADLDVLTPVVNTNVPSLRLFEKLGFTIVDEVLYQYKPREDLHFEPMYY